MMFYNAIFYHRNCYHNKSVQINCQVFEAVSKLMWVLFITQNIAFATYFFNDLIFVSSRKLRNILSNTVAPICTCQTSTFNLIIIYGKE